MTGIIRLSGVRGFLDSNGTAQLNLEDVARGLGFTDNSKGTEYIRWSTIRQYLIDFGFSQEVAKDAYIPENIFYRLAMKAKNETAEAFQAKVADEILPSIRKTGGYNRPQTQLEVLLMSAQQLVEQEKRLANVEKRLDDTAEILALHPVEWRKKVNSLLNKMAQKLGGHEMYQGVWNQSYDLLEERAACNLSIRQTNIQKRMALEGAPRSKIDKVSRVDAIAEDGRLTEIYLAIVKEMAVKHGVGKEGAL